MESANENQVPSARALGTRNDEYFLEHLKQHDIEPHAVAIAPAQALREQAIKTVVVSSRRNCAAVREVRSLLAGDDYDRSWRCAFGASLSVSLINRALYARLGNRGHRRLLGIQERHGDARALLRRIYRPSVVKRLLPWARWRYRSRRQDAGCDHIDCQCIWCRMGEHA